MRMSAVIGFSVGPIASAGLGFVTIPLIAWTFAPEDVGRFNVFQQAISFLLLFSTLGLDQAYAREFHEQQDRGWLLLACAGPGLGFSILLSLIGVALGGWLAQRLYDIKHPLLALLTFVAFLASFCARYLSLTLRMNERGLAFSLNELIPRILVALLIGIAVLTHLRPKFVHLLLIATGSAIVAVLISGWGSRVQLASAVSARITLVELRPLFELALPLLVASMAYWGLTAANVIALRRFSTLREIAVYGVSLSVANAATLLQSLFTVVWAPIIYKWVGRGENLIRVDVVAERLLAVVCAIFVAFGLGAPALDRLLPPQYVEVKYLVMCSIVPPLLYALSEVTGVGIVIARRTTISVWVTGTALASSAILASLLVPSLGARGAAVSHALSFVVLFVGKTEASCRVWRQMPRRRLYLYVSASAGLAVATTLWASGTPTAFAVIWGLAGVSVALGFASVWRDIGQEVLLAVRPKRALR